MDWLWERGCGTCIDGFNHYRLWCDDLALYRRLGLPGLEQAFSAGFQRSNEFPHVARKQDVCDLACLPTISRLNGDR